MTIVLDASVAVAAVRVGEPSHPASYDRMLRVLRRADDVVVPTLFTVEVASALTRAGESHGTVRSYVAILLAVAAKVPELDPNAADRARETAMALGLRAADAIYVALASAEGLPLCTLDRGIARRAARACEVIAP